MASGYRLVARGGLLIHGQPRPFIQAEILCDWSSKEPCWKVFAAEEDNNGKRFSDEEKDEILISLYQRLSRQPEESSFSNESAAVKYFEAFLTEHKCVFEEVEAEAENPQ